MSTWFGIDFGTTNSAVVSLSKTGAEIMPPIHYGDDEGRPMPSVVAINKENGDKIIGRDAKDNRNSLIQTHEYISSIKTDIDKNIKWNYGEKEFNPENIATEIFSNLKNRIERNGNIQINEGSSN